MLQNILILLQPLHRLRLHSADHVNLVVLNANTDSFGQRGFSVSGPAEPVEQATTVH